MPSARSAASGRGLIVLEDSAVALFELLARAAGTLVVPPDLGCGGASRRALGGLASKLIEGRASRRRNLFFARVTRHRGFELGLVPLFGLCFERFDRAAAFGLEVHQLGEDAR